MVQKQPSNKEERMERLTSDSPFKFNCRPGVSCFTECCQDVSIVLTPYDVLRLKNSLGISSDAFLDRHTVILPRKDRLLPVVLLKMSEETKKCTLVTPDGCRVYPDRPWPCRMFPLDMEDDGSFRLITDAERCKGLEQERLWKLGDWLDGQEIGLFEEMNELLTGLTTSIQSWNLDINNPKISKMVFMALYNLDKFREFVFKSSFLDRLEVEPERIEKIKKDDVELLRFGYDWLKFGLFGEKLFWVKDRPQKK
jgi:Fe-S-cluster containining protein